ncbi:MAG: thiamine-phosphate kinase [Deltaproteobacteria bacterium]|nr:thiamine-phosphate kinase [Deltaproteobacteria bacterium]
MDIREQTLADWGEFSFIGFLRDRLPASHPELLLGIGDDASWWRPAGGEVLTTTDMLVEGVHFDLAYTSAADLGWKSLAVNLSDLAAMGGRPACVYLALGLPGTTRRSWLEEFIDAFLELADHYGVQLAGGDTVRSETLVISVALNGIPAAAGPVRRAGARPGDDLYLSGSVGDSFLGLRCLQGRLSVSGPAGIFLRERHLRPRPRVELGAFLGTSGMVNAMLDVSDGLIADLGHLLSASGGWGAELEIENLPLSSAAREALRAGMCDYPELLTGGEDFELLFSLAPDRFPELAAAVAGVGVELTRIGRITSKPGIFLLGPDRLPYQLDGKEGYDHFQTRDC